MGIVFKAFKMWVSILIIFDRSFTQTESAEIGFEIIYNGSEDHGFLIILHKFMWFDTN